MNFPLATLLHRKAFNFAHTHAGLTWAVANARNEACRFAISSAAEMPLPTTSPNADAQLTFAQRNHVVVVAADRASRLPQAGNLHSRQLRNCLGEPVLLDLTRSG